MLKYFNLNKKKYMHIKAIHNYVKNFYLNIVNIVVI